MGYGTHQTMNMVQRYISRVTFTIDKANNYREFSIFVNRVDKLYDEGHLQDCELFLSIDNMVTDCAYYKG